LLLSGVEEEAGMIAGARHVRRRVFGLFFAGGHATPSQLPPLFRSSKVLLFILRLQSLSVPVRHRGSIRAFD
jgi:hypothetical protein